jgi:hypothetical protein
MSAARHGGCSHPGPSRPRPTAGSRGGADCRGGRSQPCLARAHTSDPRGARGSDRERSLRPSAYLRASPRVRNSPQHRLRGSTPNGRWRSIWPSCCRPAATRTTEPLSGRSCPTTLIARSSRLGAAMRLGRSAGGTNPLLPASPGNGASECSQVIREQIGLFHRGEVPAAVELGPVHDVREASFG